MMTWLRIGTALALAASAVPVSVGQSADSAAAEACPRGALSVYFASGETTATPQAEALLGKIRETASQCRPDRIDLVAHIDMGEEGDRAVELSLERVNLIAGELVAAGLPADRIRIAAQRSDDPIWQTSGLRQIDVVFRKAEAAAPEVPAASASSI
jgi:outer membrane protein OmpA-like peptidoglycan-associated protein